MKKNLKDNKFFLPAATIQLVPFVVVIVRILLTLLPSHKVDMSGYNYWSHYLAERGFQGFYESLHVVYAPF